MKKLLLFILFLPSFFIYSQTSGKISGTVTDAVSKEPLPGVNIVLKNTKLGATTDIHGKYFILNVNPGDYEVAASFVGYKGVTQSDVIVNSGRTTQLDFSLFEGTVQVGQEVVVISKRPDVVKDNTTSSEFIRTEDVANAPGITTLTDVLSLSVDVIDGHFRGGREGEEVYNLSGMGITNPLTSSLTFSPILSAVEEVEIITNGFGAKYGNAQSGIINITMKEGDRNKWVSRAEFKTRLPSYKHWGGSVFSMANNPYLQLLSTADQWAGKDPTTDRIFYDFISYGFSNFHSGSHEDTMTAAKIAFALWQQSKRDLNREYDNLYDKNIEASIGGPISGNATLFLAGLFDTRYQIIPSDEPDHERQLMGNIAFDLGKGMNVKISGAYSSQQAHTYSGLGSRGYDEGNISGSSSINYQNARYWLWDRLYATGDFLDENYQVGIKFSHAISNNTFYEILFNSLKTNYLAGSKVLDPSRYTDDIGDRSMWRYFNTPDLFRVGYTENDFYDQKTTTYSFDGNITSQINDAHMLSGGLQFNYFTIDVNNRTSLSSKVAAQDEKYLAHPYEFGAYFQDKMEFEGMIANLGLRIDGYNNNVTYFTDVYSPLRNPNYDPKLPGVGSNKYYSPALAATASSPLIINVQPRIGASFPININTVFHLNYGSYLQRPQFDRTVFSRVNRADGSPIRLGNATLKPQDTKSYEVGVSQALGEGFTVDVSGFYKDVKNLIERVFYIDLNQTTYESYQNRDYADIRGFRVSVVKRKGLLTGSIRYNYQVASGKSSNPFNFSPIYDEKKKGTEGEVEFPTSLGNADVLMDYDRTHNLVLQLTARSDNEFGPQIVGFYPLEDWIISFKTSIKSGRPYTDDREGLGLRYNMRSPMEYNTDLKITRKLPKMLGFNSTIYLEIFNLFNNMTYAYNTVFANTQNARKYDDDPSSLKYYTNDAPFYFDQTFLIYGNAPRSMRLGIVLNM